MKIIKMATAPSEASNKEDAKSNERNLKKTTKVPVIKTRFEWQIENFMALKKFMKNGECFKSQQFFCSTCPSLVWEVDLYPCGKGEENAGFVSIFIRQVGLQRSNGPVKIEYQLYVVDAVDGRVDLLNVSIADFSNKTEIGANQIDPSLLQNVLRTDGSILLVYEVEHLPPKIECQAGAESNPAASIHESIREMWEKETLADCVLQIGSVQMPAHRCILAQRSAVFHSMFTQKEMDEAKKGIVFIADSLPDCVHAMLQFIYTGTVEESDLENNVGGILAIADKYAVMPLKERCERFMCSKIEAKNVVSFCHAADLYCASLLKKACSKYISVNYRTLLYDPEWKKFRAKRAQFCNVLLEEALRNGGVEGGAASNRTSAG